MTEKLNKKHKQVKKTRLSRSYHDTVFEKFLEQQSSWSPTTAIIFRLKYVLNNIGNIFDRYFYKKAKYDNA